MSHARPRARCAVRLFAWGLSALAGCSSRPEVKPIIVDVFLSTAANRMEKTASEPLQVAVNDINAAGGVGGQELQIWLHDEPPAKALLDAVALRDTGVRVFFAGPSDIAMPLIRELAAPAKAFLFASSSASPNLFRDLAPTASGNFAATSYTSSGGAKKLAQTVYDAGVRRAGILCAEDGIGPEYAPVFVEAFRALGGELTGDPPAAQFLPKGEVQKSYRAQLLQAAEGASRIDGMPAVVAVTSADAFRVLLRDSAEAMLPVKWFGAHTVREKGVLDEHPEAAEGMQGVVPSHARGAAWDGYLASFRRSFPDADPLATWSPNAYDAMVVYALTLARSGGSAASPESVKANLRKVANAGIGKKIIGPADLASALSTLSAGGDVDYQGPSGSVDFNAHGEAMGNWSGFRVVGGQFLYEGDSNY